MMDPPIPGSVPVETGETARPLDVPDAWSAATVALWPPRDIGWAAVLLGFPGATLLAALNWRRMGRTRKGIVHMVAAIVGTWALFFVSFGSVGLVIDIGVGYYLNRMQRTDQAAFRLVSPVTERGGLRGAALALIGTIVILVSGVVVANAAGVGSLAHRGEVMFGTHAATDACSMPGQTSVFAPSDGIFSAAIMRESVKSGSHVVYEIDAPDGVSGPSPINAQPPFDCLSTTTPLGPLDPGAYVVRYRYDGQPGSPDLARGTFTVRAPAGSLPASAPAAVVSLEPTAAPPPTAEPSTEDAIPSAFASGYPHEDVDLEASLPPSVAGRSLTRWSVRGKDFLSVRGPVDPAALAQFEEGLAQVGSTLDDVSQATAGRSREDDPPFFVLAIRFKGHPAADLPLGLGVSDRASSGWVPVMVAGKKVARGTADMLTQDSHIRGIPYVYSVGDVRFIVVSDQPDWVTDAIRQLP